MRHVRILAHRDAAAERTSARTRSRSAELERRNSRPHTAMTKQLFAQERAQSPKRPRMLAPMEHNGANLQREAQEIEEQREQSELSHVLSSFAIEGATRHGRSVELELSRIKDELSPHEDRTRQSEPLPPKGTRVVLTGLVHGGNYNGREAEVLERDGKDRLLVQVCGASELCQLSVKPENVAIVHPPVGHDVSYEDGRDFSQIHELATLHAQQNAKREVQRLASEADERRRAMEHTSRADSLRGMNHGTSCTEAPFAILHPVRQRCRYGNKCAKPDCMDLHPWEAEWVQSGADSGCNSKSKLKAAKGIYNHLTPAPRAKGRRNKTAPLKSTSPTGSPNRGKDSQMAEAAVEIDRILAQAGVPVAARKAAHENVLPLLCSNGQANPSQTAKTRVPPQRQGQKLGQGRLGGVRALGSKQHNQRDQESIKRMVEKHSEARRPKTLQELQSMQESLQRSLEGNTGLLHEHRSDTAIPASESSSGHSAGTSNASLVEADCELGHRPSWRDHEDPDSRQRRIMQLVEIKKAEYRRKKLMCENAMLHEALAASGAFLSDLSLSATPMPSDSSEKCLRGDGVSLRDSMELESPAPTGADRRRPHVIFSDDMDIVFESS